MTNELREIKEDGTASLARTERYRPYPAYRASGLESPVEIPANWSVRRLKRVHTLRYGDSLPSSNRSDGRIEVFGSNGPIGTHGSSNTKAPCLVIGRKGSFGKVTFSDYPVFAIDTTFVVDSESTCSNVRWLYYVLQNAKLDLDSKDSAIPGIDREDIYHREVSFCGGAEQRAIAAFLDRQTAKLDALGAKKERLIDLLQVKRTALITRAVTKGLDPGVPMRDSGVEWLGKIPAHWDVIRLFRLTPPDRKIMYGIVLPGPNVRGGVPIVKGGDVSPERLSLAQLNRTSLEIEARYARSRLCGGDLVYSIKGSIGEVEVVPDELEGANLTQDAARVAYVAEIHGPWLLFALKSRAVFSQLEAGALGATIRGINIRDLKRAVVPRPPPTEQRAIAAYLSREAAKIDALVAKVREAIERLKELRTALVSAAVTGKIDVRGTAA